MEADGNSEEPSLLVLVLFKTDLGHPYKVPESSISIPASLTRFGLSTVVNNLITSVNPYWESEPFDFLIKNELVRMWLEKFLLAKNISAERILEIKYIRAVVPGTHITICNVYFIASFLILQSAWLINLPFT
ncbi:ribosome biogenesis protein WDR12 homolog isoform X1 [Malus domestica]|uniref:ribosome biogenesis protein WDR12 homolog isoform X1 n=1 Tax=Malus domestica TaxID=3750 RepID=UPI000498B02A